MPSYSKRKREDKSKAPITNATGGNKVHAMKMTTTCGVGTALVSVFLFVVLLDFAKATVFNQMQAIQLQPSPIKAGAAKSKKAGETPTILRVQSGGGSSPEFQAGYDTANQMVQLNSATPNLTYDGNGNLVSQADASGTISYTWDARDRLVGISGPGLSASFVYDALNRRVSKTINGVTMQYQYDGKHVVAEFVGGALRATYLRHPETGELFIRTLSDGSHEYYHTDGLGSIIALTDDTGAVKTRYTYDEFGNVTMTGTPSTNPFQYTGQENDGTGLYYYKARYYSPQLRRFISEDPIEFEIGDDLNRYAYVGNNPTNFVDPDGTIRLPPGIGGMPPRPSGTPQVRPTPTPARPQNVRPTKVPSPTGEELLKPDPAKPQPWWKRWLQRRHHEDDGGDDGLGPFFGTFGIICDPVPLGGRKDQPKQRCYFLEEA